MSVLTAMVVDAEVARRAPRRQSISAVRWPVFLSSLFTRGGAAYGWERLILSSARLTRESGEPDGNADGILDPAATTIANRRSGSADQLHGAGELEKRRNGNFLAGINHPNGQKISTFVILPGMDDQPCSLSQVMQTGTYS